MRLAFRTASIALAAALLVAACRNTSFTTAPGDIDAGTDGGDTTAPPTGTGPSIAPTPGCRDDCLEQGTSQCILGSATYETCLRDADGCLHWLKSACREAVAQCDGSEDQCIGSCPLPGREACDAKDARRCAGSQVEVCNLEDGCLVWSAPQACPAATSCIGAGECLDKCVSSCKVDGDLQCQPGTNNVQRCTVVQPETDCKRWGVGKPCGIGKACSGGVCVQSCVDDQGCSAATLGDRRCSGPTSQKCAQVGPCFKFVDVQLCSGCCKPETGVCLVGTSTLSCGLKSECTDCNALCAKGGQSAYACTSSGRCDCRD